MVSERRLWGQASAPCPSQRTRIPAPCTSRAPAGIRVCSTRRQIGVLEEKERGQQEASGWGGRLTEPADAAMEAPTPRGAALTRQLCSRRLPPPGLRRPCPSKQLPLNRPEDAQGLAPELRSRHAPWVAQRRGCSRGLSPLHTPPSPGLGGRCLQAAGTGPACREQSTGWPCGTEPHHPPQVPPSPALALPFHCLPPAHPQKQPCRPCPHLALLNGVRFQRRGTCSAQEAMRFQLYRRE